MKKTGLYVFASVFFWTLDMPFFHFQMTLLYFGLSLSLFSLVGGQTDVPSQPFWGEERNQGLLEKNHQHEELRLQQQQNQQQPNLNATSSSNAEESWPLRECIAILGLYSQNAIVFKFRKNCLNFGRQATSPGQYLGFLIE